MSDPAQMPEVMPDMRLQTELGLIDRQIATAKQYPRDIAKCLDECTMMIQDDQELAEKCIYNKPVNGELVTGPSVRLAEIVGTNWTNIVYDVRIVEETQTTVVAEAVVRDLEKNVSFRCDESRSIVGKTGKRFPAHLVELHKKAAKSIALRDALFRVIPKYYVNKLYNIAREVAVGDAKNLGERRKKAFERFGAIGVTRDMLMAWLEVSRDSEITAEHIGDLIGLFTALKDGEAEVDVAFTYTRTGKPMKSEKPEATPQSDDDIGATIDRAAQAYEADGTPESPAETQTEREPGDEPPDEPEPPQNPSQADRIAAAYEAAGIDTDAYDAILESMDLAGVSVDLMDTPTIAKLELAIQKAGKKKGAK